MILFNHDVFFSVELTQNMRYVRLYPFLFHEMLYALGMTYHHSLSSTSQMVRVAELGSELLVQHGGNCIIINRRTKLNEKVLFTLSNILGTQHISSIVDIAPILSSIFDVDVTFKDSANKYDFLCSCPLFSLVYSFMLSYLFVTPIKSGNGEVKWWEKFFSYIALSNAVTRRLST